MGHGYHFRGGPGYHSQVGHLPRNLDKGHGYYLQVGQTGDLDTINDQGRHGTWIPFTGRTHTEDPGKGTWIPYTGRIDRGPGYNKRLGETKGHGYHLQVGGQTGYLDTIPRQDIYRETWITFFSRIDTGHNLSLLEGLLFTFSSSKVFSLGSPNPWHIILTLKHI